MTKHTAFLTCVTCNETATDVALQPNDRVLCTACWADASAEGDAVTPYFTDYAAIAYGSPSEQRQADRAEQTTRNGKRR